MKKLFYTASLLIAFCFWSNLYAQQANPVSPSGVPVKDTLSPTSPATLRMDSSSKNTPTANRAGIGFGINFATNGLGIDLAKNLTQKGRLALRLSGNYLPVSVKNQEFTMDQTALLINADVKLGSIGAILDIHPFGGAFKVSAGYSILLTEISATAITKDSTKQGDIMIPPAEVGIIKTGITFKPSPYIGMGIGRAVPKRRVGFTMEVGAYYIEQPKLSFKATGMLEPTSSQESVLQNNLKGLSWLPVLNMSLNFRLSK